MKPEQIRAILIHFGLTPHESAVYLAALQLGPATVLDLARRSGVKRTTVYSVINDLQQRGLMIREMRGWKTRYVAEHPEKLVGILEARKEELQRVLPDLAALYTLKGDSNAITFYDGLEAVKSVYERLIRDIRPHEDYLVLTDLETWRAQDAAHFQDFIERRAKLPINIRILAQPSALARQHKKYERAYNETIAFLPENTTLTTNLVITPQRVVIHQIVPPIFAMVIENPNIIKMHREQFEIMWKACR